MLDSDIGCFTDIFDIHSKIPVVKAITTRKRSKSNKTVPDPMDRGLWPEPASKNVTYYEVGKLAFDLLPIVLSKIQALGGSAAQKFAVSLRTYPSFYLIKSDPLELEKVKAAQAIEDFLKV